MFDEYLSVKSFMRLLRELESNPEQGHVTTFELFKKDGNKITFKIELVHETGGENVIYFCKKVKPGEIA